MDLDDLAFLMGGDLPEPSSGPEWRGIWVVAELTHGEPSRVTRQALGKARELGDRLGARVEAVVLGADVAAAAETLTKYGADVVHLIEDPALATFAGDTWVDALTALVQAKRPEILLLGFTAVGREVAPRLAQRLGTGLVANASELDLDESARLLTATRQSFGGRALATVTCPTARPQMATLAPNAFREADYDAYRSGDVEPFEVSLGTPRVTVTGTEPLPATVPLERAPVIVCGGKGLGGPVGVQLLKDLAAALGGQVAGTRGAVEAGYVDASQEISARGVTVAPDLYVGVGVSGALDHLNAMRQARTIVLINQDAQAPLASVADYTAVGDLQAIIPAMLAGIQRAREKRAAVGVR